MASKVMARYVGPGFYPGIPDHDLDADDWEALSDEQRELVSNSTIYKVSGQRAHGHAHDDENE